MKLAPGFNLEAHCRNVKCPVSKRGKIWIQKTGSFNVIEQIYRSVCPECQCRVVVDDPYKFGFKDCMYEIEGENGQTGKEFHHAGETEDETLTIFKRVKNTHLVYLNVITTNK